MQLIIIMLAKNKHIKIAMTKNKGVIITDHPNVFCWELLVCLVSIEAAGGVVVVIADEFTQAPRIPLEGTPTGPELGEEFLDVVPLDGNGCHRRIDGHDDDAGFDQEALMLFAEADAVNDVLLHFGIPFLVCGVFLLLVIFLCVSIHNNNGWLPGSHYWMFLYIH